MDLWLRLRLLPPLFASSFSSFFSTGDALHSLCAGSGSGGVTSGGGGSTGACVSSFFSSHTSFFSSHTTSFFSPHTSFSFISFSFCCCSRSFMIIEKSTSSMSSKPSSFSSFPGDSGACTVIVCSDELHRRRLSPAPEPRRRERWWQRCEERGLSFTTLKVCE